MLFPEPFAPVSAQCAPAANVQVMSRGRAGLRSVTSTRSSSTRGLGARHVSRGCAPARAPSPSPGRALGRYWLGREAKGSCLAPRQAARHARFLERPRGGRGAERRRADAALCRDRRVRGRRAERNEPLREAFERWDGLRRTCRIVGERDAAALRAGYAPRRFPRSAAERSNVRAPRITALDNAMKQRFLDEGVRAPLEAQIGAQAFALWHADVAAFDEAIAGDLIREPELSRAYTDLLAAATVPFAGEERTLSGLAPFLQDGGRESATPPSALAGRSSARTRSGSTNSSTSSSASATGWRATLGFAELHRTRVPQDAPRRLRCAGRRALSRRGRARRRSVRARTRAPLRGARAGLEPRLTLG